jgi:hypothetical protein
MERILVILLVGAAVVGVVALLLVLVVWRILRRRLRVDPKTASIAPVWWNVRRGSAAQAHQRLRMASQTALRLSSPVTGTSVRVTTGAPTSGSALSLLGQSIAQQAVVIERELVTAARTHRTVRAGELQRPIASVSRLEAAVQDLRVASTQWNAAIDGPPPPDPLLNIQDQIVALRLASEGVQSIERNLRRSATS